MIDGRLLPDTIQAQADGMDRANGVDLDLPFVPINDVGHSHDGLKGIALSTTGRTDVSLSARDAHIEVEYVFDDVGGDARTVVLDGQAVLVHSDLDNWGNASLLAGINGVVHQLLERHERPLLTRVANLGGEPLL